jgi:SAM-dependent methyltransferase
MAQRSELDRYISSEYFTKNPTWHEEDAPWKAGHIADAIEALGIEPTRIADIGCGTGAVVSALADRLRNVRQLVGYEPSPDAASRAERLRDGLSITRDRVTIVNDVFDPERVDEPFDVLLLIDVLEHMENPFAFLRSIKGSAPYVVAHIPLDLSVQSVLRMSPLMARRQMVGHIHWFTAELARELFTDLGYEIVSEKFTAGTLDLPAVSKLSAAAKLPRRVARAVSEPAAARLLGGFSLLIVATPGTGADGADSQPS